MNRLLATCFALTTLVASATAAAATTPAPVTVPGSTNAVVSRVAASRDGTIAVAWGAGKVEIRRAGRWLALRHLATGGRYTTGVDVAFDSRGALIATWVQAATRPGQGTKGPFEVRAATWTVENGWGATKVLGHSGHFLNASARVTTNAAGGSLISWQGIRRNAAHQVRDCVSTSIRPAGGAFGREQQIADGGPYQDVRLDDRGNAYAVWTRATGNTTVNRFAYHRRGSAWGSPKTFSGDPSSLPSLAVTQDGAAVVAYRAAQADSEGNGTQTGAVFTVRRSAAGVFSKPQLLSTDKVHDVRIAASPAGEVLVAWGTPALSFSARPPQGSPSAAQSVPGAEIGPLAYSRHGDALVAYGTSSRQIELITRPRTGADFGAPLLLGTGGLYPALSVASGHGAVSWLDQGTNRLKVVALAL